MACAGLAQGQTTLHRDSVPSAPEPAVSDRDHLESGEGEHRLPLAHTPPALNVTHPVAAGTATACSITSAASGGTAASDGLNVKPAWTRAEVATSPVHLLDAPRGPQQRGQGNATAAHAATSSTASIARLVGLRRTRLRRLRGLGDAHCHADGGARELELSHVILQLVGVDGSTTRAWRGRTTIWRHKALDKAAHIEEQLLRAEHHLLHTGVALFRPQEEEVQGLHQALDALLQSQQPPLVALAQLREAWLQQPVDAKCHPPRALDDLY
mmetsp:Transcript_81409/g.225461  ORF Transcript_81409/g.225461 Transcript_81409/m.225461 type:complete len:269 (+) Transcript_81409:813-1619(+)